MDWAVLSSTLLAFVLYINTWRFGFVYDDNRAILTNEDVLPGTTPLLDLLQHDFWGTPLQHSGSHGSYRPLTVLSFRLNVLLGGPDPMGFHILNTVLHAAATAACTSLARRLSSSRPLTPWVVGLLFAAHPIHTEAVAGIVGRADVGASLFFLLALLSYMQHPSQLVPTFLFGTCATLTKETGLTVFIVCFLYDLVVLAPRGPVQGLRTLLAGRGNKEDWQRRRRMLALVGFTAVLMAGRTWLTGGRLPVFATADNPASRSDSFITRTLTFLYLPVLNIWLMLCPTVLSFDWSMDAVPLVRSPLDPRNFLSLLLYTALGWSLAVHVGRLSRDAVDVNYNKRFRSQDREDTVVVLMGIILLTVPFLPASNLLAYVGFVVAERVLYLPSMGFCLLVGHGITRLRPRKPVLLLALVVLAFLALRTLIRNRDWRSEETLYRSGIAVNPPKAYGNLGNILSMKGDLEEAEMCYRRALQYRPNMADVHYNLGVLLQNQERLDEAMYRYRVAIQCRPRLAVAHLNLGLALAKVDRQEEAHAVLRGCADLDGAGLRDPRTHEAARVACLFHLGRLAMEQGKLQQAIEVFLEAVHNRPHYYAPQSLFNMLGEAYSRLGRDTDAEPWFRASLSTRPDHVPAHLTYGKLLARNRTRVAEAEQWYSRAESLAPKDPAVFRHFGQFLMAQKRYSEAAIKLQRAVNLTSPSPEFEDVISTATSLRLSGDLHAAEKYYKLAISIRPTEASSIANLGALYHLTGRLEEAEVRYQDALKLVPEDDVTRANLRRLRNLQRLQAERHRLHKT